MKHFNNSKTLLELQVPDNQNLLINKKHLCQCEICTIPIQVIRRTRNRKHEVKQRFYQSNFNMNTQNPFIFLLLHLRNYDNKNPINVNIPEMVVCHRGRVYDMIYSKNGHIRSYKKPDENRLSKSQVYSFLKRFCHYKTNEQYIARLTQKNEYLMLSDFDLQLICLKNKLDPIWNKFQYLQNKVQVQSYTYLKRSYSNDIEYDNKLVKLATESLIGTLNECEVRNSLTEEQYLDFNNIKICFFLNYQHNIRVSKCDFMYLKCRDRNVGYILADALNLEFLNLTEALKRRYQRLEKQMHECDKKLEITPEKYTKIRKFQNTPLVKQFQDQMKTHYQMIYQNSGVENINFMEFNEQKSESAFKRLHPKSKKSFKELITSRYFYSQKDQILGNLTRRSLVRKPHNAFYKFSKISVQNDLKKRSHTAIDTQFTQSKTSYKSPDTLINRKYKHTRAKTQGRERVKNI